MTSARAAQQGVPADAFCAFSVARFAIRKNAFLKNKTQISYHRLCWGKASKRAPLIGAARRG